MSPFLQFLVPPSKALPSAPCGLVFRVGRVGSGVFSVVMEVAQPDPPQFCPFPHPFVPFPSAFQFSQKPTITHPSWPAAIPRRPGLTLQQTLLTPEKPELTFHPTMRVGQYPRLQEKKLIPRDTKCLSYCHKKFMCMCVMNFISSVSITCLLGIADSKVVSSFFLVNNLTHQTLFDILMVESDHLKYFGVQFW